MPTIRCVEPAVAAEGPDEYRVYVNAGDALEFPHVDSCLAIGFVLSNGAFVGGHVSVQEAREDAELRPHQNAMNILAEMQAMVPGGVTVDKLVLVGDRGTWRQGWGGMFADVVQAIRANLAPAPPTLYVNKEGDGLGGGVDVTLNPRRRMVFINRCVGGGSLVFQRPWANINGLSEVNL